MKKWFCICLSVLLCLPLLFLSVCAEDVGSVVFSNPNAIPYDVYIDDVLVPTDPGVFYDQESISLSYTTHSIYMFDSGRERYRTVVCSLDDSLISLSTDSSSPTILDGSVIFSLGADTVSSSTRYYFTLVAPPLPDPLSPVSSGVNTFIGYGGQVLSFISNNSTLLFLIGLSVGLCLVIPFGVSKIKELIKGY